MAKALDVNGTEIKRNDLVKVVKDARNNHAWLRVGNTLRVIRWEDRPWFGEEKYIVVFLKSKKGGRHCSMGIQDKLLEVIEE